MKAPILECRIGAVGGLNFRRLLRREILVITQTHHVLEHRRSGRQIVRVQELRVKEIITLRSAVDRVAALEYSRSVLRVVHADQRSSIVDLRAVCTAVLEVAQEVVHTAVGAEVLQGDGGSPAGLGERNTLTSG